MSDSSFVSPFLLPGHRYHFSSALQRMSVLARVALSGATEAQTWALVKGSPEAIGALLADKPKGYDATYRAMAERGMRVLALAVKSVAPPAAGETLEREEVESGLRLCGFVAFSCLVRGRGAAGAAAGACASPPAHCGWRRRCSREDISWVVID